MTPEEVQHIEIHLLLEALKMRFGYDFHGYSKASLYRRIDQCLAQCEFQHISDIIPRLLYDSNFLDRMICQLSITTTEMFRDPAIYQTLRQEVLPILATYPFINIWHAGCATGEEVYSLAILLKEAGLFDRTRIYATDINNDALDHARAGVYPMHRFQNYADNYRQAGGQGSLADYYHARYDLVRMNPNLAQNMVFANHNLATDGVFAEIHLLLCRNVFIYFDQGLQDRVLGLFLGSLVHGGFLCLGRQETVDFSSHKGRFTPVCQQERIWRKLERHHA